MDASFVGISELVQAIVDTGASRCVIGSKLVPGLLQQIPSKVRSKIRQVESSVKFRFGNNQTLTSERRLLLPLRCKDGKELWLGVEVVPGLTPFLFSKRALKQLGGRVCTVTDTCTLEKLHVHLPLDTSASGLYLLDVANLCCSSEHANTCQSIPPKRAMHEGL